jgi:hypothetical protein
MVWTYPTEAPVRSGVISRTGTRKRGRGKPNFTWEESVKRGLKYWSINKELCDNQHRKRGRGRPNFTWEESVEDQTSHWKLAIHVSEP